MFKINAKKQQYQNGDIVFRFKPESLPVSWCGASVDWNRDSSVGVLSPRVSFRTLDGSKYPPCNYSQKSQLYLSPF